MKRFSFGSGLFLLLSLLQSACNHLFYYPDAVSYRDPAKFNFPVKAIEITRADKPSISAWLMNDNPGSKGLILHFHGNAQNLSAHSGFSSWFAEAGYTVLIFDYSGYGRTAGSPTQKGLIEDSQDVMHWIQREDRWKSKGLPLVVFAQSLGGAVATTSLAETPAFAKDVDLLIVESSFDSYQGVAFKKMTSGAVSFILSPLVYLLVSDYREPGQAVKNLKMKKIIVHGNADEVVPFASGKALFEKAEPPKEFWEIPYGNHTEAFIPGSPYRKELLEKIESLNHKP
jgi:fermentation-respiration switch protein FrsA (DUF1100 family)